MTRILLNPITNHLTTSLDNCRQELLIAVPFMSSFAKTILTEKRLTNIRVKRIITRFDSSSIHTFDLDTMQYLLKHDVEIYFNNDIHLKLYIYDDEGLITSSNLTQNGFENKIELSSTIAKEDITQCKEIFNHIYESSKHNVITSSLIEKNYEKFLLLKKRNSYKRPSSLKNKPVVTNTEIDINKIIPILIRKNNDYTDLSEKLYTLNLQRDSLLKSILSHGLKKSMFYVDKGCSDRESTIHYQIVHGVASKIEGSGLREDHFKDVSKSSQFFQMISYIFPPSIGEENWNLDNKEQMEEYCHGIFDFDIKQYKETMPIRLASYFYPEYFYPVFKLEHFEGICQAFGLQSKYENKGERLFQYTTFLDSKLESIPYNRHVKMKIAYQIYYIFILKQELRAGMNLDDILNKYLKKWERDLLITGNQILAEIEKQ